MKLNGPEGQQRNRKGNRETGKAIEKPERNRKGNRETGKATEKQQRQQRNSKGNRENGKAESMAGGDSLNYVHETKE